MTASGGEVCDVAVVGYGPVGQALTALLAQRGHRVVAVERWPALFPLPRAGHVDAETMRIFQALGVAQAIEDDSWKLTGYELRDSQGDVLHSFEWGHEAGSGWYSDYSLFQPELERLLHESATSHPEVTLLRGWQAEELAQDDEGVDILLRDGRDEGGTWIPGTATRALRARYVVGCDGANSIVRDTFGMQADDLGFEADWLVVFAEPSDPTLRVDMPDVAQLLDPTRPTTAFRRSGRRFHRWEFMLMPGETAEEMSTPETAWRLIERWGLTPDNARLVRNTVFRFRSLVVREWRDRRAFVAGDAAHLMPPFLGQGMCSGLRDAKTLAWKLDLVLRGVTGEDLLATYTPERHPHVTSIVRASLGLGELISMIDPEKAAQRDARLRSGEMAPPAPMPGLVDGVLRRGPDGDRQPVAGHLSLQARVGWEGDVVRMDDVVGAGWTVLGTGWDVHAGLSPRAREVLELLDARVVRVEDDQDAAPGIAADVTGAYRAWLGELGATAVILRPDFYLFGAATDAEDLEDAIEDLRAQLGVLPRGALAPADVVTRAR